MTLDRDRPKILTPPQNPPACCTRQPLTVPPQVTAKTAQKHDYPSAAHRRSCTRRTGAERGFATAKDPASNDAAACPGTTRTARNATTKTPTACDTTATAATPGTG